MGLGIEIERKLTSNIRRIISRAIVRDVFYPVRRGVIQHGRQKGKGVEDHGFGSGVRGGEVHRAAVEDLVVAGEHGGVGEGAGGADEIGRLVGEGVS